MQVLCQWSGLILPNATGKRNPSKRLILLGWRCWPNSAPAPMHTQASAFAEAGVGSVGENSAKLVRRNDAECLSSRNTARQ